MHESAGGADARWIAPTGTGGASLSMLVLASGSSGNCTVLRMATPGGDRVALLDAGLSPRRTAGLLEAIGLSLDQVTDIVFTHLDSDHAHAGWAARRFDCTIRVHRAHMGRAARAGLLSRRAEPFDEEFALTPGVRISPCILSHDSLGVAAFRITGDDGASLGFATDLGHVSGDLIDHLRGVDVLAIESNYCPILQEESGRPRYLIDRITGGGGHLSNQQCADAVRWIGPRAHVVLLHLSQECNRPEIAAAPHEGAPYLVTVSSQESPTDWIEVRPAVCAPEVPASRA